MLRSALLLLLLTAASGAAAQPAALAGRVTDAETGEPLPAAAVLLSGARGDEGRATGPDGRFRFDALAPGRYALAVSSLGYATLRDTLTLAEGERAERPLALWPIEAALGDVVVEGEGVLPPAAPAGLIRLRPADLARIPAPGLSGDLAGILQVLPGFVALGDRGGQLYVRGGTPTENLVLVDGMPVFQPFHIVGGFSAVPADLVRAVDVYAGGFGARYGGRLSSVIDVETTNGSKRRWRGSAALAPFLAGVHASGPLVPGHVSGVFSVRESLVEQAAAELLGEPLPYRFGDAFAKVHALLDPRSSVTITGLSSHDAGALGGDDGGGRVSWGNRAARGRFFYLPPEIPAALDISAGYSAFRSDFAPAGGRARASEVEQFGGEFALQYLMGANRVRVGFGAQTMRFAYAFDTAQRETRTSVTEGTLYVDGSFALGRRLHVEPGLRLHTFPAQATAVSWEPRLRAAWEASARHTLSAAGGLYRQEILGLTDAADIGDVFTAWAPVPQGRPVPTAVHAIAGWEARWRPWASTSAEAYAKRLTGMTLLLGERGLVSTDGDVRGLDLRAEWRRQPLGALVSYGFSAVTYRDGDATYRPPHDRRHRLSAALRAERGPWALGLGWQLASGRPFTRVAGTYAALPGVDPDGRHLSDPGVRTFLTEDPPFAALTPAYHRLDVTLERTFRVGAATVTAQAAAVNAYDRANFFYYDAALDRRVDGFPLLPSLGLRVAFD